MVKPSNRQLFGAVIILGIVIIITYNWSTIVTGITYISSIVVNVQDTLTGVCKNLVNNTWEDQC